MRPLAMENPETRCIECGGAVHSLNEDEAGEPCVACAERLLETLPGIFHSPWSTPRDVDQPAEAEAGLGDAEADGPGEHPSSEWWRVEDDVVIGPDQPA
ncbi:hypothetical protein N9L90_03455 [Planctomycetota bacterium]|jgi:hypothetical protein|nr:hypothetical protein [Planctomycetota bacterium]